MKHGAAVIVAAALVGAVLWMSSHAATVTVTLPDPSVPELLALCDSLRIEQNARNLSNEDCAYYFLSIGLQQYKMRGIGQMLRTDMKAAVAQAQIDFDILMPPYVFDVMVCGDNILDNDPSIPYIEECDDGNTTPGDGCSEICEVE